MRACPMQVTTAAAKAWQTSIVTDTGDGPEVSARTCAASTNTNDSTPVGTRKAAVTNTRDSTMWWDEDSTEATEANVVLGEQLLNLPCSYMADKTETATLTAYRCG